MLTWDGQIETSEYAMETASQASARLNPVPMQLDLLLPTVPQDLTVEPLRVDEDPVISRIFKGTIRNADEWIRLIAEGFECSAHKTTRKADLKSELERAFSRFLKSVQGELAQPVAMCEALDQPLQHEKLMACPTYCPVQRFGPYARGPPIELNLIGGRHTEAGSVPALEHSQWS